ncbi:MAG: hypothetical protein V2I24_14370 [Halieaceae bacterium]|nr:hypothetical protein [Halieaceae bacterium]
MNVSNTLVKRYRELWQEAEGAVLLMRAGAFTQVKVDDARTVSVVTGHKLLVGGDIAA